MTQPTIHSNGKDSGDPVMLRKRRVVTVSLIFILVASAYGNSLWNGLVYDDRAIVGENPLIRRFSDIPTLFVTHYWQGASLHGQEFSRALYRPLVLTTYTLNYLTTGLAAWAFHLTNVLLHLGVVLVLYRIARRLGLTWPGAMITALVFAVHPLNTEAVTGIVGRAELIMTLGVLTAFYWDLKKNPPTNPFTKLSLVSLTAFAVGSFAKEQAILLPALLVVADAMRGHDAVLRSWWSILWNGRSRYLGYLTVAAVYVAARASVLGTRLPPTTNIENPLSVIDGTLALITAVKVAGIYLWLAVWPANLSADYSYNSIAIARSTSDPTVWVSALAWSLLFTLGAIALFKRNRPLAIGIAITFLFFLPAANIIVHIGTIMGERLFYLPMIGLCLALGTGWDRVARALAPIVCGRWQRMALAIGAATLMLAPLTARTVVRNRDWQSNSTIFQSVIRARPRNVKIRLLLGTIHHKRGELDKALEQFEAALAILPRYVELPGFAKRYGALLVDRGRVEEGVAVLETSIRLNPEGTIDAAIHRELSKAHEKNKSLAKAAASRRRAIEIGHDVSGISLSGLATDYSQLARLYTLQGKTAEGLEALETALNLVRRDEHASEKRRTGMTAQILGNMALIDTLAGNYERAETQYLEALELLESPLLDAPTALRAARLKDYARLLQKMGRHTEAVAIDKKAASFELP